MARFFTSDLHIRHDLVVRERGFFHEHPQSGEFGLDFVVVDHDAYEAQLADNWDSRVKKDDIVYVLGDIAMNPKKGAFEWLAKRPGNKVLISGNHDATHPMHSSWMQALRNPAWRDTFDVISSQGSVKIGGQKVLLSHFPYEGEGDREIEDRHVEWRLRDMGIPLLHGHTHSTTEIDHGHSLHVGLDSWNLELVHELSVEDWLRSIA